MQKPKESQPIIIDMSKEAPMISMAYLGYRPVGKVIYNFWDGPFLDESFGSPDKGLLTLSNGIRYVSPDAELLVSGVMADDACINVKCPRCGTRERYECRQPSGAAARTHRARIDAYKNHLKFDANKYD